MSIKGKSSCLCNLDKRVLQQVTETPYLGILLSEDLGWSKHIAKTASKASSRLGFLCRNLLFQTRLVVLKQDVVFSILYLAIE
jgi:hypothetical protein